MTSRVYSVWTCLHFEDLLHEGSVYWFGPILSIYLKFCISISVSAIILSDAYLSRRWVTISFHEYSMPSGLTKLFSKYNTQCQSANGRLGHEIILHTTGQRLHGFRLSSTRFLPKEEVQDRDGITWAQSICRYLDLQFFLIPDAFLFGFFRIVLWAVIEPIRVVTQCHS